MPTFADDWAWFGWRNTEYTFAGRREIVTNPLCKLFGILTIGEGFEAGSLHCLYNLEGLFPICEDMCSLYTQNKTFFNDKLTILNTSMNNMSSISASNRDTNALTGEGCSLREITYNYL